MATGRLCPPIITLLTDFRVRDSIKGLMKGDIPGIAPRAPLVNISQSFTPQHVFQTANIRAQHLEKTPNTLIIIKNMEMNGNRNTFGEGAPVEMPAMMACFGYLSFGADNVSAAEALDANVGEIIRVDFLPI